VSLITDLLDAQLAILRSDFKNDLLPPIQQANNLIASNPTEINLIAQGGKILQDIMAEGPTVLQDEAKGLATWLNGQLQQLANPPPAPVAPAATPAAKPA
jgi:hypothetical protein